MSDFDRRVQMPMPAPSKLFTPFVTALLVGMAVSFVMAALAGDGVVNLFGLSLAGIRKGMVWQLVTYTLVHPGPIGLALNGLMVLFIGSMIEREWKTLPVFLLWLTVSVVCGIIWLGVSLVMQASYVGIMMNPFIYGLLGVFLVLFRDRRLCFFGAVVEGKWLALIFIALGVLINIRQPIGLVWILGALVGYLYVKFAWKIQQGIGRGSTRTEPEGMRGSGFVDLD